MVEAEDLITVAAEELRHRGWRVVEVLEDDVADASARQRALSAVENLAFVALDVDLQDAHVPVANKVVETTDLDLLGTRVRLVELAERRRALIPVKTAAHREHPVSVDIRKRDAVEYKLRGLRSGAPALNVGGEVFVDYGMWLER